MSISETDLTVSSIRVLTAEVTPGAALARESVRVLLLAPRVIPDPAEADQFQQFSANLPSAAQSTCDAVASLSHQPSPPGFLSAFGEKMARIRTLLTAIPRHDIVHVFHFSGRLFLLHAAPAIILAKFFGKKVILSYSDSMAELDLERSHEIYRPILRLCDRVVVSSHYLRTVLSGYRFDSEVMPGGIAGRIAEPKPVLQLQPRIVMVRPLERQAGYVAAIRAFKLVKQKFPRAEMVIAGDGTRREYLQNLVSREKILGITFETAACSSEIDRLIMGADLFLSASVHDSIPAAIWRALSAGLPIVATDTGGVGEIIKDRQNGLLARVNDFSGIADRIIELIETPELVSSLSEAALATAERHAASGVCNDWQTLYRELR